MPATIGALASCLPLNNFRYCDSLARILLFNRTQRARSDIDQIAEAKMQGDKGVLTHLNKILKNELTAINQYFLHARMLDNWGLEKLGKYEYGESIDEMKHADSLIARILFLDGLPNLQDLGRLRIGETITELLQADLALEMDAIPDLRVAIAHCESVQDYVSRELLEHILESEEEHVDFIETQLQLIERIGVQNYQQSQMKVAGA
jgi:bacterioferritin